MKWYVHDLKTSMHVFAFRTEAAAKRKASNLNKKETWLRYVVMKSTPEDEIMEI